MLSVGINDMIAEEVQLEALSLAGPGEALACGSSSAVENVRLRGSSVKLRHWLEQRGTEVCT
jgi:hypothetical protein